MLPNDKSGCLCGWGREVSDDQIWSVVARELYSGYWVTELTVGNQRFRIAEARADDWLDHQQEPQQHCEFMRDMLVKAIEKICEEAVDNYCWDHAYDHHGEDA